jgi:hypothetical protein
MGTATLERPTFSVNAFFPVVERVLCERAGFYTSPDAYRTLTVFDRERGQFLLLDEGWDGYRRIHRVWAHIEARDGKLWIQEDGTQDGLANDLMRQGVPEEAIVLGFHHPSLRPFTDFPAS